MITAIATSPDGTRLLIVGVTTETVLRLVAGQPIHVTEGDLNVMICFGEDDPALVQAVHDVIGPDTRVVVGRRAT